MSNRNGILYGVGINDWDGQCTVNSVPIKSYDIWKSMLRRCYDLKVHNEYPTYIGCSVCDEWLSFNTFKEWFDVNYIEGYDLDKDILIEGNKIYSPNTCVFVPPYLNKLLNDNRNRRGAFPIGVNVQMGKSQINPSYVAKCSNGYGGRLNKNFKTVEQAHQWYLMTKTTIVREQALRAFMDGSIKTDVYVALVRRKFK